MYKFLFFFISGFIFVFCKGELGACTGLQVVAKNGAIVHGRTLEFGRELDTSIGVIPRRFSFKTTTPLGTGLTYISKYAAIGALLFDVPALMDGINEKGLAVGAFYFPGFANYAKVTPENQSKALSPIDFSNWILTQFASIEEVKAALSQVFLVSMPMANWGNECPPFHYIVYDRKGNSLVIEPLEGKLVTYDNPLGVITNSPSFDWHMNNLRNYINLRAVNVPALKVKDMVLAPFGQGSGMVGLPGDFTPPSRFVRAAIFTYTATPSLDTKEAVLQTFHLLNQFDIPVGLAREVDKGSVHTDYTMVTCVRDPQGLKYYFKTYEDQSLRMADLKSFDLNSNTIKTFSTKGSQEIIDVSSKFIPK